MEKQPFYFELEDQLKMFLNALDGCIVTRYNNRNSPGDKISVRYVYAPKQRALHDLVNKEQHITLPCVAFYIRSVSLDKKRVFNKIDGSNQFINGTLKHIPQPLPVKIDLDISILTKYQADMDQIISNMTVYFQDYITISWNRFNLPYHEIRNKVIWGGSISLKYPVDVNENQPTRIQGDTTFSIEGWLFKADDQAAGIVRNIEASFSAISAITNSIVDLEAQVTAENTESFTISGAPIIHAVYPYAINVDTAYTVNLYGSFIHGISAAYLSSSDVYPTLSSTFINPFSAYPTLSADNPGFYAFPVEYVNVSENNVSISVPPALSAGFIDVIFLNKVGYGKLTDDASSPYASGIAVYST